MHLRALLLSGSHSIWEGEDQIAGWRQEPQSFLNWVSFVSLPFSAGSHRGITLLLVAEGSWRPLSGRRKVSPSPCTSLCHSLSPLYTWTLGTLLSTLASLYRDLESPGSCDRPCERTITNSEWSELELEEQIVPLGYSAGGQIKKTEFLLQFQSPYRGPWINSTNPRSHLKILFWFNAVPVLEVRF